MTDNNPQSAENGVARWLVLRRREDLAPELPNAAIDDGWSRKRVAWRLLAGGLCSWQRVCRIPGNAKTAKVLSGRLGACQDDPFFAI